MISLITGTPLAVADELRPVLFRLARELRRETEQFGVTGRQVSLMQLVKRNPGLPLKQLADDEGISPPALSGHIDRLERAGLVERTRSQVDRRRVGLTLTPAGDRLLRRVRERRTTWLAERLGLLDSEELAAVEAAIAPLMRLTGESR
jgi:DNA-binding MarR family transcriptional regulator